MRKILLSLLILFYCSAIFAYNFLDEKKSKFGYCGKFLVSVSDSKSNGHQNNPNSNLNEIKFMIQGEGDMYVKTLGEMQYYGYSFNDSILSPNIETSYFYLKEINPESIPANPNFIPS